MANIRTVASAAEVSTATVSRAFNDIAGVSEDVRDRVIRVAAELGYAGSRNTVLRSISSPSRTARLAPASPTTNFVAFAYTGRGSLSSPYDVALLEGISTACEEQGVNLVFVRFQVELRAGETARQVFERKGIFAAILRTHADSRHLCLDLAREKFPAVVIGDRFEPHEHIGYVDANSRDASYSAVEHLISMGHRRIALATSHVSDRDHHDRISAYEQALRDNNLEIDPKLIQRVWAIRTGGEQAMRTLMSIPDRPTALFATDPLVAVGAINQAHEMGLRIPDDLSIVGFDDTDVRHNVYPRMSAVCQDARAIGYEAMTLLGRRLSTPNTPPFGKVLPTFLELHSTTGKAPEDPIRVLPDGSRISSRPH